MTNNLEFDRDKFQEKVIQAIELIAYSESIDDGDIRPYSRGSEESQKEAETLAKRQDIKQLLCPGLKTVLHDTVEVSKEITPVLIAAVLAETIVIPLNPILFAWLAIVITRAGVEAFCADIDSE